MVTAVAPVSLAGCCYSFLLDFGKRSLAIKLTMRTTTITHISIYFYNDDIPVKKCVTNQMLNDVPSSTNQTLNVSTLTRVIISNHELINPGSNTNNYRGVTKHVDT